jgi:hypothetical protein
MDVERTVVLLLLLLLLAVGVSDPLEVVSCLEQAAAVVVVVVVVVGQSATFDSVLLPAKLLCPFVEVIVVQAVANVVVHHSQ